MVPLSITSPFLITKARTILTHVGKKATCRRWFGNSIEPLLNFAPHGLKRIASLGFINPLLPCIFGLHNFQWITLHWTYNSKWNRWFQMLPKAIQVLEKLMQNLGKEYKWQITNAMEPSTLHFEAQRSAPYLGSLLSILMYAHCLQKLYHTCKCFLYHPIPSILWL